VHAQVLDDGAPAQHPRAHRDLGGASHPRRGL